MGPSFLEGGVMCWSCPSVCPVPPPRGKTKKPTKTKLGRKGPWTPAPRGSITKSKGQRSRSRRLIAQFAKNPHNFAAGWPINFIFGRCHKDPSLPCPGWSRYHGNGRSLRLSVLNCKDGPIAGGPSTAALSCWLLNQVMCRFCIFKSYLYICFCHQVVVNK